MSTPQVTARHAVAAFDATRIEAAQVAGHPTTAPDATPLVRRQVPLEVVLAGGD